MHTCVINNYESYKNPITMLREKRTTLSHGTGVEINKYLKIQDYNQYEKETSSLVKELSTAGFWITMNEPITENSTIIGIHVIAKVTGDILKEIEQKPVLVSIIIPTYNGKEITQRAVESLYQHIRQPFEIIAVDNGSTDGTLAYWHEQEKKHNNIKVIVNAYNQGYPIACNQGMKVAKGQHILLCNNDVEIYSGVVERLSAWLQLDEKIGMVGPLTNNISGHQQIPAPKKNDELAAFAHRIRRENDGEGIAVPRIVGFCMMVKKEIIQRIGGYDPLFSPGNFEDDDLCVRSIHLGYTPWTAVDVFVNHFGSHTIKREVQDPNSLLIVNKEKFYSKWHVPQEQTSYHEAYMHACSIHREEHDLIVPLKRDTPWPLATKQATRILAWPDYANEDNVKNLFSIVMSHFKNQAVCLCLRVNKQAGDKKHDIIALLQKYNQDNEFDGDMDILFLEEPEFKIEKDRLAKSINAVVDSDDQERQQWIQEFKDLNIPTLSKKHTLPITLCMIVKNEEQHLENCLQSVTDIVSEMIVVDTGSRDETVTIAKRCGAKVIHHKWQDDFSMARNISLQHAQQPWILVLDADEQLRKESKKRIAGIIEQAPEKIDGYVVSIVNHTDAGAGGNVTSDMVRLFRNNPLLRFRRIVHETIDRTDGRPAWVEQVPLIIDHYGYISQVQVKQNKAKRNRKLLEKSLQQATDDKQKAHDLIYLGQQFMAEYQYEKAIDYIERGLALLPDEDKASNTKRALYRLTNAAKCLNNNKLTISYAKKWAQNDDELADPMIYLAEAYIEEGELNKAYSAAQNALEKKKSYIEGAYTWRAYSILGALTLAQGKHQESRKWVKKGYQHFKSDFLSAMMQLHEKPKSVKNTAQVLLNGNWPQLAMQIKDLQKEEPNLYAYCLVQNAMTTEALELISNLHDYSTEDMINLIQAVVDAGDCTKARKLLQMIINQDGYETDIKLIHAHCSFIENDMQKAAMYCLEVIDKEPQHVGAYELLIRIFIKQNRLDHAREMAAGLLQIEPQSHIAKAVFNRIEGDL